MISRDSLQRTEILKGLGIVGHSPTFRMLPLIIPLKAIDRYVPLAFVDSHMSGLPGK